MARPKEPWKRQRLLDVAMGEVASRGAGTVTLKDVARAAGVSTGTVHYHFADIDGMMFEVIERALEQTYTDRLVAIDAVDGIPQKIVRLVELGIPDAVSSEVTMMYDAIARMRQHDKFRPVLRSYLDRQASLYRSVIDAGIAAGLFAPVAPVETIARNLLALEDAYCLYLVLGVRENGSSSRAAAYSYAASALQFPIKEA
jgi:AcrR family transcriptional regulator